ncbi:hypothetical protein J2Z69_000823 [Paenibacillus shirakamiensis]|uniref:F0F1-type ATP synthase n=1 Tax=Paenibacillus shirakamiensis TaxID=1265935 RepID=A0ABS4JDM3_9BACL|nr:hypothetical protein [Paenibacillus shirakamiensis]MBP1999804.1 hypothetical protein [Paenibacillus shirakamiensis]
MKITDLAIVFILIVSPLLWIGQLHSQDRWNAQSLSLKYSTALRTAVQDGASQLNENELQDYETSYSSSKFFRSDADKGLNAFLRTLYLNLGIENDPKSQESLMNYIPAVMVIDYAGYYMYRMSEYKDSQGQPLVSHQWSPLKPYAWTDVLGNVIEFTLDEKVTVFTVQDQKWHSGQREELAHEVNVPLLANEDGFEAERRRQIVLSMESDLSEAIAEHNSKGKGYQFTLPMIPQEDWNNTIDDIGMVAFLQGLEVGDQHYNNYALAGGRLKQRAAIYGGTSTVKGLKYFYRAGCNYPYIPQEVFSSTKEAASKGYFEAQICQ